MSADFIKHLRSVHALIVITSLTLLLTLSGTARSSAETAYDDCVRLQAVARSGPWLEAHLDSLAEPRTQTQRDAFWFKSTDDGSAIRVSARQWRFDSYNKSLLDTPRDWLWGNYAEELPRSVFRSAAQFRHFWNWLNSKKTLNVVEAVPRAFLLEWNQHQPREFSRDFSTSPRIDESTIHFDRAWLIAHDCLISRLDSVDQQLEERARRGLDYERTLVKEARKFLEKDNVKADAYIWCIGSAGALIAPAEEIELQVYLQAALFDHAKRAPPPEGTFEQSFPELASSTRFLEDVDLQDLRHHFDAERKRNAPAIEVGVAKIPSRDLATWGLLVLVGIQLYFVLHLRASLTANVVESPPPTPWIGIYPGPLARIAFAASSSLLPIATSIALMVEGGGNTGNFALKLLLVTGATASLAWGCWTVRIHTCLHTRREPSDASAPE